MVAKYKYNILKSTFRQDEYLFEGIAKNELPSWDYLYEEYAGVMYGCIYSITGNHEIAEKLFMQAFLNLRKCNLITCKVPLSFYLWNYSRKFTLANFNKNDFPVSVDTIQRNFSNEITTMICLHDLSITEFAKKLSLSELQVKQKLHVEFAERI